MLNMNDTEKITKIEAIIKKHKISCGEDIWQSDRVDGLQILDEICEVVGYYDEDEEKIDEILNKLPNCKCSGTNSLE